MKRTILICAVLMILSVQRSYPSGPDSLRQTFEAVRIERPIELTGRLDDPLWLNAVPVELSYEIMPSENTPAGQRTVAMVLYDQENLYVGFRCYDSLPGLIRSHLCDRDQIFKDDFVDIIIDTYGNYQRGYEFAVNPAGIQGDLLMMGSGYEDSSYDMVWYSEASIDDQGWIAEMAIPFRELNFSGDESQQWTVSLLRNMPRENRYLFSWTINDRNIPSLMAQGGILTGLEGINPGHSLGILPYTMIEQSNVRADASDPDSEMDKGSVKVRIGGGLQYSPGPSLNLNAVVNPDFSQIESDADQISVNTTFALYYPEKRPFFMAGMDLIQTPMYYSRTINNPLFAGKVNGKLGNFSYLTLAAYDRNTAIIIPGEENSNTVRTDMGSYVGALRLRYDLGNENFIGILGLSRNFTGAHNYLGGFDWSLKFWKNWYFKGELFLSDTKEINDTSIFYSGRQFGSTGHDAAFNGEKYIGTGMHIVLTRSGRNYTFSVVQNNFSPTYQTYNGMFPSVNSRASYMNHRYTFYPNKKIIKRISLQANLNLNYNYDGLFKEISFQPSATMTIIGQTSVSVGHMTVNRERFSDIMFKGVQRTYLYVNSSPVKGLTFSLEMQSGKYIYRSSVPELGKGYDIGSSVQFEPGSRLKTGFSFSLAKLDDLETGEEFYQGYILRNSTTFQFTRKLFLRNIIQYNSFSDTFCVYPLVSYKFNAFTMFCAGVTCDMKDYQEDAYSFRPTKNQYFIKLQYLFSK